MEGRYKILRADTVPTIYNRSGAFGTSLNIVAEADERPTNNIELHFGDEGTNVTSETAFDGETELCLFIFIPLFAF
jgi:hypothetical protein